MFRFQFLVFRYIILTLRGHCVQSDVVILNCVCVQMLSVYVPLDALLPLLYQHFLVKLRAAVSKWTLLERRRHNADHFDNFNTEIS